MSNNRPPASNVINVTEFSQPLTERDLNNYPNQLLQPPASDGLDLREFWRTLLRKKKLIFSVMLLITLITVIITLMIKPIYRASTTLQIDREATRVVEVDFMSNNDFRDNRDFYQTQFELIKSRSLAQKVIQELQLESRLVPVSLKRKIKNALGFGTKGKTVIEPIFLENLYVEPIKNSRLVLVSYDSNDPVLSAKIVNSVADNFIKMNLERRFSAASYAKEFLISRLKTVKETLVNSEKKLNEYARKNDIMRYKDEEKEVTSNALALKKMTEALVTSEVDHIKARSTYQSDKTEKNKNLFEAAREREKLIREKFVALQTKTLAFQDKDIEYHTLQREVDTNQALYKSLLQRLKDIDIAGGVGANNMLIIDRGVAPTKKYKPSWSTNLSFGILLGLLMGVSVAFLSEFMDDSIRELGELEKLTALPSLGIIPNIKDKSSKDIAKLTHTDPKSNLAEAFRSLRTSLRFLIPEKSPKIIFFTSACAAEGKSTAAVNLASAYAQAGNSVLLIDSDLRNPSVHQFLNINNKYGLSDLLSQQQVNHPDVIQASNIPYLSVLPSGTTPPDPVELLASNRMKDLLQHLSYEYDQIILDGPPILGLADALVLSNLSTATILSVYAGQTKKGAVTNSLKRLRQAKGNVVGTILARVDPSMGTGYGYDYLHYYYNDESKKSTKPKRKRAV